jgi:hypothetical protein
MGRLSADTVWRRLFLPPDLFHRRRLITTYNLQKKGCGRCLGVRDIRIFAWNAVRSVKLVPGLLTRQQKKSCFADRKTLLTRHPPGAGAVLHQLHAPFGIDQALSRTWSGWRNKRFLALSTN